MNVTALAELMTSTLSQYISDRGGPMHVTNEVLRHSYAYADILKMNPLKVEGGVDIKFDAILTASGLFKFTAPMEVRQPKLSDHTRRGTVPWSFSEFGVTVSDVEEALNEGKYKIFDVLENRTEAAWTDAGNSMETTWWDEVGNYDHVGEDNAPFWGMKAWVTRDGLAVDGSATLAGISTTTHPRWLSRFAGPLGNNLNPSFTHDAGALTSAVQLRKYMKRAWRYCRFKSPNGTQYAQDDTRASALKDHKIYVDEIGYDALERTQDAIGHGNDRVAPAELDKPDPTFKGIPATFIEDLGLGSGGVPTYAAHASSGSTTITAATYPNTGECFMTNMSNFKPFMKSGWNPKKMPTEFIALQQCFWTLFKYMMGTVCNSRQRQCCLWGFAPFPSA